MPKRQNPIQNFEVLENKYKQYSNLNYSFFRFVLLKNPNDNKWHIQFGQIILSKEKLGESYKDIYKKDRIWIVEYSGDKNLFNYFLLNIKNEIPFLMYNLQPQVDVFTNFNSCSNSIFVGSDYAKENFIAFPHEKIVLLTSDSVEHEINKSLVDYPSLDLLIFEKLKIRSTILSGLKNRITIYFEIGLGKIKDAVVEDKILKIKLEINEKESEKYVLKAFIEDKYGETQIIQNFLIKNEIKYNLDFIPGRARILLIYEDKKADDISAKIEHHFNQEETEQFRYDYDLKDLNYEIANFKNKIKALKSKVDSDDIQIGELTEKRLIESEKKTDLDDILQALSEAMEYICKDYCDLFGIKQKKVGLQMHNKIVQHWIDKSKKDWTALLYQTGVRHIIRLGSLKEHNAYKTLRIEIDYLKLLAWRGYFELLRMMKEVQTQQDSNSA